MTKERDEGFLPLAEACAVAKAPYMVAWRAAVAGRLATRRDGRGRWYVRPAELHNYLEPRPIRAA